MLKRDERGFTLVELLIVLIILALLVAIVIPAISGFLGRGREESFNGDERNLQAAVDAYYTDSSLKVTVGSVGFNVFPTDYDNDGGGGVVTRSTDVIIDMNYLKNLGYIRDIPASAAAVNHGTSGHYIWVVQGSDGTVKGCSSGTIVETDEALTSCAAGYDGQYP